jgi:hypothetical protein
MTAEARPADATISATSPPMLQPRTTGDGLNCWASAHTSAA